MTELNYLTLKLDGAVNPENEKLRKDLLIYYRTEFEGRG